jgi:tetratricopeptide (TPR) repeat protein
MTNDLPPDTILDQIESLLNENDVAKATAVIKEYRNEISLSNKRFQNLLVVLYSKRRDKEEAQNQSENQTIHYGNKRYIGLLLDKIQTSRESGDFQTARDYCREWLGIDPDSERAKEVAKGIETSILQQREHLVALNRSKYFMELKMFQKALDLLESIPKESEFASAAEDLCNEINLAMREEKSGIEEYKIMDEITRLLDKDHLEAAMELLENVKEDDSYELGLLRTKIERAIENQKIETDLSGRLWDSLENKDMDKARIWLGMIVELNPNTLILKELSKNLDYPVYENLTNGLLIT